MKHALERLLDEAEALLAAGRFAEGEARAREVSTRQPRNARSHYLLALAAHAQDSPHVALERVDVALKLDRVNARYLYLQGMCLAAMNRADDAITSLRRALQFEPAYVEARGNLGILLERSGQLEQAAECYRKVATERPTDVNARDRLGHCARMLGRTDESIAALRQSIGLHADSAGAHNELALALLQAGNRIEALPSFRRAVGLDPGFLPAWANLAKLLYLEFAACPPDEREPLRHPVLEAFDRVLALEPGHEEFRFLRDAVSGKHVDRPPDAYVSAFFDRFAPQFDEHLTGKLRYKAPAIAQEMLQPWLGRRAPVRVLDIGCGTGLAGKIVHERAASLAGVDLSVRMLERARALGIYDALEQAEAVAYLERCPARSCDLVLALDVFIYVGALERILPAIARVLDAGGRLLCSVEDLEEGGFALAPTGRYRHASGYVERIGAAAGLVLAQARPFIVREEAGRAIEARMLALDKTG